MADTPGPDSFGDVNEAVGEVWEAETTPYERVRQVIGRQYGPVTADSVAEDARTSPKTARKHLETLAGEGFVTTGSGEHGATTYRRSAESLVVEQAAEILSEVSVSELRRRVTEMRETIGEFRDTFGVESPDELAIDRTNRTLSGDEAAEEPDAEALRRWRTTRRNLAFANAALSIANAKGFVDGAYESPDRTAVTE